MCILHTIYLTCSNTDRTVWYSMTPCRLLCVQAVIHTTHTWHTTYIGDPPWFIEGEDTSHSSVSDGRLMGHSLCRGCIYTPSNKNYSTHLNSWLRYDPPYKKASRYLLFRMDRRNEHFHREAIEAFALDERTAPAHSTRRNDTHMQPIRPIYHMPMSHIIHVHDI